MRVRLIGMVNPADIDIPTGSGQMPGHLWLPEGGTGPGLLLLQEIFGVSPYIKRRAADLAALGYAVVAPEIYWRLDDAGVDESGDDFLQQAMAVVGRLDWPAAVADSVTALEYLRCLSQVQGGAGVIGFCFGGGLGFNVAAVADPDVLISYYGSALPNLLDLANQVSAPSLHHFGTEDAFIDRDSMEEIRRVVGARPDTLFETHAGAGHAFDNSDHQIFFHSEASATAWQQTVSFLRDRLPVASP